MFTVIQELNEESYLSLFKQPKLFCGDLKKHQIEGLLWIRVCILYIDNFLNERVLFELVIGVPLKRTSSANYQLT